jgi:hypothetical protein
MKDNIKIHLNLCTCIISLISRGVTSITVGYVSGKYYMVIGIFDGYCVEYEVSASGYDEVHR